MVPRLQLQEGCKVLGFGEEATCLRDRSKEFCGADGKVCGTTVWERTAPKRVLSACPGGQGHGGRPRGRLQHLSQKPLACWEDMRRPRKGRD